MKRDDWMAICWALATLLCAAFVGAGVTYSFIIRQAVRAGAAEWASGGDGSPVFRWKGNE